MDLDGSNKQFKIKTINLKRNYETLRKHKVKNEMKTSVVIGQKFVVREEDLNQKHEQAALASFQSDLEKLRVEIKKSQAHAVYDKAEGTVYLLDKLPSMAHCGYRKNNRHYLYYFEAVAFLELKRLQIDFCGLPMSIEQAYVLLLGEKRDMKFDSFFVYSHLTRLGFNVFQYQNIHYDECTSSATPSSVDCCWEIAMNNFQTERVANNIRNSKNFDSALTSMLEHRHKLIGPTEIGTRCSEKSDIFKKSRGNDSVHTLPSRVLLEQAEINEYTEFQNAFNEFLLTTIPKHGFIRDEPKSANINIAFDLYLPHQKLNKKMQIPPVMRVVVLADNQLFPSHNEIRNCYMEQLFKAPLALIHFGKSKQVQCFLYTFS